MTTSAPALPLAPIRKTVELPGRHGLECWAAVTQDGLWEFERTEGVPSTPWEIRHLPSVADGSWTLPVVTCSSLRACRSLVASGGAEQELAWRKEEAAVAAVTGNPGSSPCGHPPYCACATPAISADRLDGLDGDWRAEMDRATTKSAPRGSE